jgi:hypothetical protein
MVKSQIDILTFDPCFDHNLCCKYSNGSCKPILDIYISRIFQWYKKKFNPMNFYPSNHSIKIWKSIGILTHKVGVHLGMCGLIPSHSFALLGMWMRLPGCTFNPHLSMLCLDHEPKIRVMTFLNLSIIFLSFFFHIILYTTWTSPSFNCMHLLMCVHTSHQLYGYPPLTLCSWQQTHWNPWCNSQHLGAIAQDVNFHMGQQQLHALLSITSNSFHRRIDIVFSKDGICTLVEIVIVDPKQPNFLP